MNPKKKLLWLFLSDCCVMSLFWALMILSPLRHWIGPRMLAVLLISIYSLTRNITNARWLKPIRKTKLRETATSLVVLVCVALFLVAAAALKHALDPLLTNIPFLVLVWVLLLSLCFYRFACDLEKLKSAPVS